LPADEVAKQQAVTRVNEHNWKQSSGHQNKVGVLDENRVLVAGFYRSKAGNIKSGMSTSLLNMLPNMAPPDREAFSAAVSSIQRVLTLLDVEGKSASSTDLQPSSSSAEDSLQQPQQGTQAGTQSEQAAVRPKKKPKLVRARPIPDEAAIRAQYSRDKLRSTDAQQIAAFLSQHGLRQPSGTTKPALVTVVADF